MLLKINSKTVTVHQQDTLKVLCSILQLVSVLLKPVCVLSHNIFATLGTCTYFLIWRFLNHIRVKDTGTGAHIESVAVFEV